MAPAGTEPHAQSADPEGGLEELEGGPPSGEPPGPSSPLPAPHTGSLRVTLHLREVEEGPGTTVTGHILARRSGSPVLRRKSHGARTFCLFWGG